MKSDIQRVFLKYNAKVLFIFYQKYLFMCLKVFKLQPKTPQIKKKQNLEAKF